MLIQPSPALQLQLTHMQFFSMCLSESSTLGPSQPLYTAADERDLMPRSPLAAAACRAAGHVSDATSSLYRDSGTYLLLASAMRARTAATMKLTPQRTASACIFTVLASRSLCCCLASVPHALQGCGCLHTPDKPLPACLLCLLAGCALLSVMGPSVCGIQASFQR